ncbi:hypothetical protein QNI16_36430 [Cytophagaceae bacterium YF14B1]|uniref:Uncharacterized protein n=1 Tax=Xanthocytophaga flava TaxID=3048013 RepID=A0AAE3QZE1_9BACT|nr:hypothetical protein [Xanthocytophaga flavus]MDJ1486026.1 hypothetical protein [Xanthocytophaga flavus]
MRIKQFCDSQGEVIFFFAVPTEKKNRKANHPIPSMKGYSLKVYYFEKRDSTQHIQYEIDNGALNGLSGEQILKQYMDGVRSNKRLARKLPTYRKLATYLETRAYQHASDTVLKIPDPNNPQTDIPIKDLYTYLLTGNIQFLTFSYKGYPFTLLIEFKNENTKEVMHLLVKNIYVDDIDEVSFQPGYYVIDAGKTDNWNITPIYWKETHKK